LTWSNDEPKVNSLLSFHVGVEEPTFGGLRFLGVYTGGDFEAGESNYLIGAEDTDWTRSWTVCGLDTNEAIQLITYQGTNGSCVPVTIRAVQVGAF